MTGLRVDFSDPAAVAANIAWAKRRVIPWLVLVAAAALLAAYLIGGWVLVTLLAAVGACGTTACAPAPDRVRLAAAGAAALLLWTAVHLHR